jgi:hypothetical protein
MSVSRGCVLGNKILDKDLYIKHYNHIFSLFKFLSLVMVLRMITTESILKGLEAFSSVPRLPAWPASGGLVFSTTYLRGSFAPSAFSACGGAAASPADKS